MECIRNIHKMCERERARDCLELGRLSRNLCSYYMQGDSSLVSKRFSLDLVVDACHRA